MVDIDFETQEISLKANSDDFGSTNDDDDDDDDDSSNNIVQYDVLSLDIRSTARGLEVQHED